MVDEEFELIFETLSTPNNPQDYNHGTAGRQFLQVNGNGFTEYRLWYQPNPGYIGRDTLSIQYVDPATASAAFYDDAGTCDMGMVTVFYENDYSSTDSVNVSTKEEHAIDLVLSIKEGFDFISEPSNGTVDIVNADGVLRYTPDVDFRGTDQFTCYYLFNGTTNVRTYTINVLEADAPNTFARNDYAQVSTNNIILLMKFVSLAKLPVK